MSRTRLTPTPAAALKIGPFSGIMDNDLPEMAYVYVCEAHAVEYRLSVHADNADDQRVCMVEGCGAETGLVHYVWDYRPEVIDAARRDGDWIGP